MKLQYQVSWGVGDEIVKPRSRLLILYLPVLYHLRTKRAKKLLWCSANCHFLVFKSRLVASKPVRMRVSATARRRYLTIALGTVCEVLYNADRVDWKAVRQV